MRIQCENCRTSMTVSSDGGQFRCPSCQTVNSVGTPVKPQTSQATSTTQDKRHGVVLLAWVVLAFVAMLMGWRGIILGLALLAWAIGGAAGKIKGPLHLVFPDSTKTTLLTVVALSFGSCITTCGIVGTARESTRVEDETRKKNEVKQQQAEVDRKAERQAAEETAERAALEKKLRANVATAAADYIAGLDAVELLKNKGKWREAASKMQGVVATISDYQKLQPVPAELAAATTRQQELTLSINEVMAVLNEADQLKTNMGEAAAMTKGTRDGATWQNAQRLWESALASVEGLEATSDALKAHVPRDLPRTRKSIEQNLKKAREIATKYEKQQAELAAYLVLCGEKPVGCGGGWDGECAGAESAFEQVAHDPSDVDVENCSTPVLTKRDCWHSSCSVRARNGFGALVLQEYIFRFSALGVEVVGEAR